MKETSEDRVAAVKSRQTKVVSMFSVMLNSEQSEVVLQDDNPARESSNDLMFREYIGSIGYIELGMTFATIPNNRPSLDDGESAYEELSRE